jgi:hypothetical protein
MRVGNAQESPSCMRTHVYGNYISSVEFWDIIRVERYSGNQLNIPSKKSALVIIWRHSCCKGRKRNTIRERQEIDLQVVSKAEVVREAAIFLCRPILSLLVVVLAPV